jgi:hypothetical protein
MEAPAYPPVSYLADCGGPHRAHGEDLSCTCSGTVVQKVDLLSVGSPRECVLWGLPRLLLRIRKTMTFGLNLVIEPPSHMRQT